jgi:nicotinamide-nucleotide amidase
MLETRFLPVFERHPGLGIAYCAHQWQVDCRISSPDRRYTREQLRGIADECAALLGDDFICFGHDSLAKVTSELFRAHGRTLAVAESCTGGLLANSFTDICGASKFFMGGIVSYSNDSKMLLLDCPECLLSQHGAVSAECAVAMASGVAERLSSDFGVAITGYAGPTGSHEDNPTGTIYIGLHSPLGDWSKKLSYPGQRGAVKQRAVTAAVDWLRREVLREVRRNTAPLVN